MKEEIKKLELILTTTKELAIKCFEIANKEGTPVRKQAEALADWKRMNKIKNTVNEIIKRCGEKQNT